MADENQNDVTALTVQLLSAFVSNNTLSSDALADLIKTTRAALMESSAAPAEPAAPEYVPAVSIRKSLSSPDYILSLIDGKPYKTLKRHLASHGLTEKDYRERYNLPASYPLVAPSYSDARRAVAERLGLGKKPVTNKAASATSASAAKPATKAPAKKQPGKAAAAQPAAKSEAAAKPAAKAAPAPKTERKKLGITGPKAEKSASPVPAAAPRSNGKANAAAPAKTSAPKAKSAGKPKSVKAALAAAGDHLGAAPVDSKSDNG